MKRIILIGLLAPALLTGQRDTAKARESYLIGRQAMRDRKTSEAIAAFNKAVELNDRSSEYYVWLGHAHTRDIAKANFMRQPIVARESRERTTRPWSWTHRAFRRVRRASSTTPMRQASPAAEWTRPGPKPLV